MTSDIGVVCLNRWSYFSVLEIFIKINGENVLFQVSPLTRPLNKTLKHKINLLTFWPKKVNQNKLLPLFKWVFWSCSYLMISYFLQIVPCLITNIIIISFLLLCSINNQEVPCKYFQDSKQYCSQEHRTSNNPTSSLSWQQPCWPHGYSVQ